MRGSVGAPHPNTLSYTYPCTLIPLPTFLLSPSSSPHLVFLNDVYKLELAKIMYLLHHNDLPPVLHSSFTKLKSIHSYNIWQVGKNVYFLLRVDNHSLKLFFLLFLCEGELTNTTTTLPTSFLIYPHTPTDFPTPHPTSFLTFPHTPTHFPTHPINSPTPLPTFFLISPTPTHFSTPSTLTPCTLPHLPPKFSMYESVAKLPCGLNPFGYIKYPFSPNFLMPQVPIFSFAPLQKFCRNWHRTLGFPFRALGILLSFKCLSWPWCPFAPVFISPK